MTADSITSDLLRTLVVLSVALAGVMLACWLRMRR